MGDEATLPRVNKTTGYDPLGGSNYLTLFAQVTSSGFHASGARILAPSESAGNDLVRVKNGGRSLSRSIKKSASEPNLGETKTAGRLRPTTPRSCRRDLKHASVVPISLAAASAASVKRKRLAALNRAADEEANQVSPSTSPSRKQRVSFAGDVVLPKLSTFDDSRSEEGLRKAALQRSVSLMGSLYDLRRVAMTEEDKSQPMTLLDATLCDLRDTEVQLKAKAAILESSHNPISENGGTRFATALISQRALGVIKRKASLLCSAEAQVKAFQEANEKREELADALLNDDCPIPEALRGFKKSLCSLIHRDGNPVDSDKTNFELFCASFGLPPKHRTIVTGLKLQSEAIEWWAHRTLQEAHCFASSDAIQRMIAVVVAICGERSHPKLTEVDVILSVRLAEKVLEIAEKQKERDASREAMSAVPQPSSAREAADAIKAELANAIALGAPGKHPAMEKSKAIEVALRIEEKNRIAAKILQAAQASQQEDAKAASALAPALPAVGSASDRADQIEKMIMSAVAKDGVPESNHMLKEARGITKALRDLEGERKRLAARDKRLAAKTGNEQK